ncbi:MAG: aminodeoxychorismate/anthranilate synthase component II [Saprospiraceae bacterium]
MEVLLIDHFDSFTYNLVQIIESCGASVKVVNYHPSIIRKAEKFDKIVLSPGPGLPNDYPCTIELINHFRQNKDFLGICLGLQAIAIAFGSKLFKQSEVRHGQNIQIIQTKLNKESVMFNLPMTFEAALYHSWAVDETTLYEGLDVTARTDNNVIMGLKHKDFVIEGVQFHPESFLCLEGKHLIQNWLNR